MTSLELNRINRNTLIKNMLADGHSDLTIAAVAGVCVRTINKFKPHKKIASRPATPANLYRFTRGGVGDCWPWTGAKNNGYGSVTMAGRNKKAHRVIYVREVGPIPGGHDLHHKCFNKLCVNPNHLIPLTRKEHAAVHAKLYKVVN